MFYGRWLSGSSGGTAGAGGGIMSLWFLCLLLVFFVTLHKIETWRRKRRLLREIDEAHNRKKRMQDLLDMIEWEAIVDKFEHQWDSEGEEVYECIYCKHLIIEMSGCLDNRKKHKCAESWMLVYTCNKCGEQVHDAIESNGKRKKHKCKERS